MTQVTTYKSTVSLVLHPKVPEEWSALDTKTWSHNSGFIPQYVVPEDFIKDLQAELMMLKRCEITVKFSETLQVLEGGSWNTV